MYLDSLGDESLNILPDELADLESRFQARIDADEKIEPKDWMPHCPLEWGFLKVVAQVCVLPVVPRSLPVRSTWRRILHWMTGNSSKATY
jgi:hypothetical protein